MTLEKQVTSLEISKRLKELGVKQSSTFYWKTAKDYCKLVDDNYDDGYPIGIGRRARGAKHFSAFTVAELGEMLPIEWVSFRKEDGEYLMLDRMSEIDWTIDSTDTEANARGEMLIYLLENKLI